MERIGEHDPNDEALLRSPWEDKETEIVLELVKSRCEVEAGHPERL